MYLGTTTSNWTSKLVTNLIMLSQDTTCIVLPEICLMYITAVFSALWNRVSKKLVVWLAHDQWHQQSLFFVYSKL